MSAGTLNLTAEQGATWSVVFTWQDGDGNLINLTGYTGRMQVRDGYPSTSNIIIELNTSNGRMVLGGAAGTISLMIAATDMTAITIPDNTTMPLTQTTREFVYDLELVNGTVVTRLLQGKWTINAEVTR